MANKVVSPDLFRLTERKSAVRAVLDRFKELLITGQLRPGNRLPSELELTASFGASRGTIREALKILAAFGIIEIRRGDGTYVTHTVNDRMFDHVIFQILLNGVEKRNLVELRQLIEMGVADLVHKNATAEDLAALEEAIHRMETMVEAGVTDPRALAEADVAFHHAFGKATRNDLVSKIYDFVMELFTPSVQATFIRKKEGANAARLHRGILEALIARNRDRLLEAVKHSISQWEDLS